MRGRIETSIRNTLASNFIHDSRIGGRSRSCSEPGPSCGGGPDFTGWADTVVRRFADHLLLHRQQKIYPRKGIEFAESTICGCHETQAADGAARRAQRRIRASARRWCVACYAVVGGRQQGRTYSSSQGMGGTADEPFGPRRRDDRAERDGSGADRNALARDARRLGEHGSGSAFVSALGHAGAHRTGLT